MTEYRELFGTQHSGENLKKMEYLLPNDTYSWFILSKLCSVLFCHSELSDMHRNIELQVK